MNQQPEALRLADVLDLLAMDMKTPRQAAAELRRLHAANLDCMAWYEVAKSQRDELLEVLKLFPGFTDDATIGDSWLWKVGSIIAKAGGAE